MEPRTRRSVIVAAFAFAGLLVWWFYPREPPRVWFPGTAPNPEGKPAERPTVDLSIDQEYFESAEVFLGDQRVGSSEIRLKPNQKLTLHGTLQLHHVPANSVLVAVEAAVLSRSSENAYGMIQEGMLDLQVKEARTRDTLKAEFSAPWTVPDHPGELVFELAFHLFPPGVRTAPRRVALICPVRIEAAP
jgi:hypothetical protein